MTITCRAWLAAEIQSRPTDTAAMTSEALALLANSSCTELLKSIPAGVCLLDQNKKIIYWNEEAERITGYRAQEVYGRSCTFLHCDAPRQCQFLSAPTSPSQSPDNCTFVHKDGTVLQLARTLVPVKNDQDQVKGLIEIFIDGVGHREVEQERNALRSILNGMRDPLYICDRHRRLLFVNQAMRELHPFSYDQPCFKALYGRDRICDECPMDRVLAGEVVSQETHLFGTGRTYEVVHTLCQFGETTESKLGVCRDITDRLAIRHRLQQVNRELDAFVSMVSHDLRSPLTPLIGFAELLEERYSHAMDVIGRESIREIRVTAEKMRDLLEDLLCLSRVGQITAPKKPVSARAVVEEVLHELDDTIRKQAVDIVVRELPDVMIPASLLADMYRNLLMNALKYGLGDPARIVVSSREHEDRVRLLVSDNGSGVDPSERAQIFTPFTRGRAGECHAGTGIGLATVAKIARTYGGQAWVEDTAGGGATFIVELPLP